MSKIPSNRPVALITGASRKIGIGASIALQLAEAGWDIAISYWRPYDADMPWGSQPSEADELLAQVQTFAPDSIAIEVDLSDPTVPEEIFNQVEAKLGPVKALILSHCQSVDSDILTTTLESFDKHFAINSRATWLLIKEFGLRFKSEFGSGRILSITSDHTAGNLPYGASKGAMDRIVLAATHEFKHLGITANVINPGATDTGWMDEELKSTIQAITPLNRIGLPTDCAHLVRFLCSAEGGWINGQLLKSNGGQS